MAVFDSIDPQWISQDPQSDLYPATFAPSCRDVWEFCVNQTEENTRLRNSEERWEFCLSLFLDECYRQRREPLLEPAETTNDTVFENIKAQYREVVDFLLKLPCIFETSKKPKCLINDVGFYIVLEYDFSTSDASFEEQLVQLGAEKVELGYEYVAPKGSNICFQDLVNHPATTEGIVRVVLKSDKQPIILDNYIPSESELSKFILSVIFDTITKTSKGIKN